MIQNLLSIPDDQKGVIFFANVSVGPVLPQRGEAERQPAHHYRCNHRGVGGETPLANMAIFALLVALVIIFWIVPEEYYEKATKWTIFLFLAGVIVLMLYGKWAGVSSSVAAEWVRVGTSGDGETTIYVDPTTIRKANDMVRMWSLLDLKTAKVVEGRKPYMSLKGQDEYDCKEERWRMLELSTHSENMARGEVVNNDTDSSQWFRVSHDAIDETLWKFACGKR